MRFLIAAMFFMMAGFSQEPSMASMFEGDSEKSAAAAALTSTQKDTALQRMTHAFNQFFHGYVWIELVAGMLLAVVLASLIAWHPRGRRQEDMLEAHEERKTFVILGLLASVVSILVVIDQTMAFVVFGIGSLIRFRTVLDNHVRQARRSSLSSSDSHAVSRSGSPQSLLRFSVGSFSGGSNAIARHESRFDSLWVRIVRRPRFCSLTRFAAWAAA